MSQPPQLFDRAALAMRRSRSDASGMFLQELARDEIEERLRDVNRVFSAPAVVTPHPAIWSGFRNVKIVPDTDAINLDQSSHDLVIHAMSLHFANDPVGQIVQCRRALKPDGLFLAVCFGGQTLNELRAALSEAEVRLTGGLSPRISPMSEIRDLGALLQRAGLALPVADLVSQSVSYETAFHLMRDLRAMGETNVLADRPRNFARKNLFSEAARIYAEAFGSGDRITATFDLVFLSGWVPHDSQQKPLRPGSAATRLADALKTTELGPDGKPAKGNKEL